MREIIELLRAYREANRRHAEVIAQKPIDAEALKQAIQGYRMAALRLADAIDEADRAGYEVFAE